MSADIDTCPLRPDAPAPIIQRFRNTQTDIYRRAVRKQPEIKRRRIYKFWIGGELIVYCRYT
jgi:hypothetical protein